MTEPESGGGDLSSKVMGGIVRFIPQRVPWFIQSTGPNIGDFFQAGQGPRIANVHVVPIFWGTAWDDSRSPNPSVTQVIVALAGILGSPYLDGLAQYGVGQGQLQLVRATRSTTSDPPSNPTSNAEIQKFLSDAFSSEALPTPDDVIVGAPAVSQLLYVVFLPPGWTNKDGPAGEHTFFDYNGTATHYAWVTHGGGIDDITRIFSHELNESVSDPEGTGITFTGEACADGGGWCEIGDVCQAYAGRLNGIWVEAYWSQQDRACVIPTLALPSIDRWWVIAGATIEADALQRNSLVAATDANGALQLFGRSDDGTVWTIPQTGAADWGRAWRSLGGSIAPGADLAIGQNADGRLELFAHGTDGAVWHIWQPRPGAGPEEWSAWASLGGQIIGSPRVARNGDGRLELFACGTDHALWHIGQAPPPDGWQAWSSLGGSLLTGLFVPPVLDVSANADGRLEAFVRGQDAAVSHIWQSVPNAAPGQWSEWESLGGGAVSQLVMARDGGGGLAVMAESMNGVPQLILQSGDPAWGGGWTGLGGQGKGQMALGCNADGRLEAFIVGTDSALYHAWQSAPGNGWAPWASLGGIVQGFGLGINGDGRFEVFHVGTDQRVYHIWQTAPSDGWNS